MMQRRSALRGVTLTEMLVATSIATVIGGIILTFITKTTELYNAQVTRSELSGYLDSATEQLRRDIWSAVDVPL